ncbi:MAG: hypothetical protein KatS3mg051_1685 [Anaerolineae bacterium]|nr:MAG: hypothetical protein KatS3mg051_1685 [Anaerolineae bacterium]
MRGDLHWPWTEQVQTLQWADQVLVLAPHYRQAEVYARWLDRVRQVRPDAVADHFVCGLFHDRLACGAGACGACEIPTRDRDRPLLACTDGPAVDLRKVMFL